MEGNNADLAGNLKGNQLNRISPIFHLRKKHKENPALENSIKKTEFV